MYDEAIKIDPNFFYAYYNKGLTIDINTINRKFTL